MRRASTTAFSFGPFLAMASSVAMPTVSGVSGQLLVDPAQRLVLHAGFLLLGEDRLGNDGDVDLVVFERREAAPKSPMAIIFTSAALISQDLRAESVIASLTDFGRE